jgi:hypothetical protein
MNIKIVNILKSSMFVFLAISITSCNFNVNSTTENREEDKDEAEKVTLLFYAYLENNDFNKTHDLFSPKFIEVTNLSELDTIFIRSNRELGKVKNKELLNWETRVKSGTDPLSEYLLVYKVTREKHESKETIRLQKENNAIKILAYNVEPVFNIEQ